MDDGSRRGVEFGKKLISELIYHIRDKIIHAKTTYKKIKDKAEVEREIFILTLGKNVARPNLSNDEYMELGWKVFAEIGSKKNQNQHSDYTYERRFLDEISDDFNQLTLVSDIIMLISLEKSTAMPVGMNSTPSTQPRLTSGIIIIDLPIRLQEMFAHLNSFSKKHCLHGSSLLQLLQEHNNKNSVYPGDYDFMSIDVNHCNLISHGLIQCKHIENSYFKSTKWTYGSFYSSR